MIYNRIFASQHSREGAALLFFRGSIQELETAQALRQTAQIDA